MNECALTVYRSGTLPGVIHSDSGIIGQERVLPGATPSAGPVGGAVSPRSLFWCSECSANYLTQLSFSVGLPYVSEFFRSSRE